ncbi:hypothetical protein CCP3SC5AM1_310008 [Gammaproteobacteria bacterium]
MLHTNLLQTTAVNKAVAIKLGSILAPAVLFSFIGGMLLWRTLHPDNHAALQEKLADLSADNAELKQQFQKLSSNPAATVPMPAIVPPIKATPPIFLSKSTTSVGKLAMLEKVLEENIQLRA